MVQRTVRPLRYDRFSNSLLEQEKSMKKLLCILLVLMLILTGCSGKEADKDVENKLKSALETSADSAPAKPEVKGTLLETKLWKLTYPDDWSCEEGALHDEEERCDVELKIKDGESIVVSAYIGVRIEGYKAFRGNLNDKGIDAYAFVKEGSLPPVNIGGVDFAAIDRSFAGKDERFCYGRMENANANITFFLRGETNDPRVEVLLSTLEFILPDVGNTDPLWPWEGVPFSGADGTGTVGSYNITSQWLPIDKPLTVFTYVDNTVEAVGDKLYILADGLPRQYALSSNALTHEKDFPLDSFYKKMSAGPDGTIYLSAFMEPFVGMRDGVKAFSHSARDTVAMHPSGDWGISYFIEPEVKKLTLADGEVVSEDLTFAEAGSVSNLYINQNHIFICGDSVANDNSSVFVYDLAGKLQYTLGDKKFMDTGSLGIVSAIVETANGFMVLDGITEDLSFWNKDGSFIDKLECRDLFGFSYGSVSGATLMPDGSIIIGVTLERTDESAMEYVFFRISGF